MGSTHVVVGHLFAKGVTDPVYFFGWGFTWVPWFFMLSGFVLFSAYLKNPKAETMVQPPGHRPRKAFIFYCPGTCCAVVPPSIRSMPSL